MSDDLVIQRRLTVVPVTLKQAQDFVGSEHRHHGPPVGHRWSLGVQTPDGTLVGVAVCGRPVARGLDQRLMLEVVRVATDGTPNACSALYGACARSAVAMGYARHNVITYKLASEPGTSLVAAGWVRDAGVVGRSWDTPSRRRIDKSVIADKERWRAAPPPVGGERP